MTELPSPEDHGAWIPFLIRKRRFAECMILAWQTVEDGIKQMTVQEFNLIYSPKKLDPRVDLLRINVGFKAKVEFLRDMGRLSSKDTETIRKFYDERNNLFHGFIYGSTHPVAISETEKTRLMELARKSSQIVTNRAFDAWFDEGTGDIDNKDIPKPERPSGATYHDDLRRRWNEEDMKPNGSDSQEYETDSSHDR